VSPPNALAKLQRNQIRVCRAAALAISAYGLVRHGRSRLHVHSGSDPTQRSGFELRGPAVGAVGDPLGWSASDSVALGASL